MVGEAEGVMEDAAADHDAVEAVFVGHLEASLDIEDVAVDDELGVGCEVISHLDDGGDELEVGGDFAHLLFGAEVDGEGLDVLLE